MKLDIKKQFHGRSFRVKGVDLHPAEPWILCSLFTGTVQIWNYEASAVVRTFEVSNMPIRACRFIARKNWIVVGGDDMQIRVFNYNTSEKVTQFEAHVDYIRCLAVHPTQPLLLSGGDDMVIKMWNWDKSWRNVENYKGHSSYVMSIAINPKDPNTFASACMDCTVKVWSLGSPTPNFTLLAHEHKGVNYVDYYPFGDKPYLITTSDDKTIRIFDYQSKGCIATLTGHTHNVSFAIFHPELPIIISGSEDSTVKVWNARSYKLEQTLNYGMERAWCIASSPNSSLIAMGFETGPLCLKFGSDAPAASMDYTGKLVWAKHLEAFSATIKPTAEQVSEDETHISLTTKDLGTIDMHPGQLEHSPNGRFVAVCGDGEYVIYTALAWRNKQFGEAQDFAWAQDSTEYAVRLNDGSVRAYKNFTERSAGHFAVEFEPTKIYGGALLGIASSEFVAFYDWESGEFVSRVDVEATNVVWADSGELCAVICEDSFYILKYDRDVFQNALAASDHLDEGVDAFELLHEGTERVRNALWVGDCFIFTTGANRVNYLVGSEVHNISHFDKEMFLLGYLPRDNAIYLCDKDINVTSLKLSLAVVEYQTVILRGDLDLAAELLEKVPEEERSRVARFLDDQNYKEIAFNTTLDPDHKFELALELNKLTAAADLARAQKDNTTKWRTLGDAFLKSWRLTDAEEAFINAQDLETLFLIYTSTGDKSKAAALAEQAVERGKYNLAFNAYWYADEVDKASSLLIRTDRANEAALFSLTWGGDVESAVKSWKQSLTENDRGKIADMVLDPSSAPDKFPANLHEKVWVRSHAEDLLDLDDVEDQVDEDKADETEDKPVVNDETVPIEDPEVDVQEKIEPDIVAEEEN